MWSYTRLEDAKEVTGSMIPQESVEICPNPVIKDLSGTLMEGEMFLGSGTIEPFKRVFYDHEGRLYYPLSRRPNVQSFVYLIGAKVMPLAPIVKDGQKKLSQIVNIPPTHNTESPVEIEVDAIIMELLFDDWDHYVERNRVRNSGTYYHFDFDRAFSRVMTQEAQSTITKKLKDKMKKHIATSYFDLALAIIKPKLEVLNTIFGGTEGVDNWHEIFEVSGLRNGYDDEFTSDFKRDGKYSFRWFQERLGQVSKAVQQMIIAEYYRG